MDWPKQNGRNETMAEITSGSVTVMVLNDDESRALESVLSDWIDDSYTRGIDCGDEDVLKSYRDTLWALREVMDAYGVEVSGNMLEVL
jgi:hypothetical protein